MGTIEELATVLGRERRVLEILLFKLTSSRLLLAAGEARFLAWASAEVERAAQRVTEIELLRATLVNRLARELGVAEAELTLRSLAEQAPEPFGAIFDDHRRAFGALTDEIEEVSRASRALAKRGADGMEEALGLIDLATRDAYATAGAVMGSNGQTDARLYGPDATTRRTPLGPSRFTGSM